MAKSQQSGNDWTREFAKHGLGGVEIQRLFKLRRENEIRRELEHIPEQRRLEFIRWMVATGRISDQLS